MLRLWLLAACLSLVCCGSSQRAPVSSRAAIEEIRALIAEERLDEAEEKLLSLGEAPNIAPARDRLLGHIAVRRGKAPRALTLLTPLRKPDEPDPWLDWDLARAYITQQNFFAALDLLSPLIESPPAPVARQLRMAAGEVAAEVGDHRLALRAYGLALAGHPEDSKAFMGLARATFRSGSLHEAEMLVSARVAQYPDEAEPRLLLGEIFAAQNKSEEAAEIFTEVTSKAPGNHGAWRGLGFAQFRLGQYKEAVHSFDRAREGVRDDPAMDTKLGQALAALGRYYEAADALLGAARSSPDSPEVWRSLIAVQLDAGDAPGAVRSTRRAPRFLRDGDPDLEDICFRARLVGAALMLACGIGPSTFADGAADSAEERSRVPLDKLHGSLEALSRVWLEADLGAFDPVRARQMLQLPPVREVIRRAARSCLPAPPDSSRTAHRPSRSLN
jgi:tetratricopeptide (TPR) repeat protein